MPIARFQMPDGRVARFEVPEGTTPEQAQRMMEQEASTLAPPVTKPAPETGFMAGLKSGVERLKGDVGAIGAAAGVEGAEQYAAAQRQKAGEMYQQPKFTESPVSYVTGLLGQSAPYMLAPIAAGAAGAAAAPVGLAGLAGAAAAGVASAGQFTGSNISRQLEEGRSAKDVNVTNAVLSAIPQAALDTVALRFIPGLRNILGAAGRELTEQQAAAIVRNGIVGTTADAVKKYGPAVLKTSGVEGLTESAQQVLERAQAGLNITDEKAREEYFDSFIGGAVLGGTVAVPGRAIERGAAQKKYAAEAEVTAGKEREAAAAAEAERKAQPAYILGIADQHDTLQKQIKDTEAQLKASKPPKKGASEEQVTAYEALVQQRKDLIAEFRPVQQEYKTVASKIAPLRERERVKDMTPQDVYLEQFAAPEAAAPEEYRTMLDLEAPAPITEPVAPDLLQAQLDKSLEGLRYFNNFDVPNVVEVLNRDPALAQQYIAQQVKIPELTAKENQAVLGALKMQMKELGTEMAAGRTAATETRETVEGETEALRRIGEKPTPVSTTAALSGITTDLEKQAAEKTPGVTVEPGLQKQNYNAKADEFADVHGSALFDLQNIVEDVERGRFLNSGVPEQRKLASSTREGLAKQAEEQKKTYVDAVLQEAANRRAAQNMQPITTDQATTAAVKLTTALDAMIKRAKTADDVARQLEVTKAQLVTQEPAKQKGEEKLIKLQGADAAAIKLAKARGDTAQTLEGELRRRRDYVNDLIERAVASRTVPESVQIELDKARDAIDKGVATRAVLNAAEDIADRALRGQTIDETLPEDSVPALRSALQSLAQVSAEAPGQAEMFGTEGMGTIRATAPNLRKFLGSAAAEKQRGKATAPAPVAVPEKLQQRITAAEAAAQRAAAAVSERKAAIAKQAEARVAEAQKARVQSGEGLRGVTRTVKAVEGIEPKTGERVALVEKKTGFPIQQKTTTPKLAAKETAEERTARLKESASEAAKERLERAAKKQFTKGEKENIADYADTARTLARQETVTDVSPRHKKTQPFRTGQSMSVAESFASKSAVVKATRKQFGANSPEAKRAFTAAKQQFFDTLTREARDADNTSNYDDAAFRIGDPVETPVDAAEAKAFMDAVLAKLPANIKIKYAADLRNAPGKMLVAMTRQGLDVTADKVKGAVLGDGTVVIIGNHHSTMEDLEKTVAHELAHYGTDTLLGPKGMQALLNAVDKHPNGMMGLAEKMGVADDVHEVGVEYAKRYEAAKNAGATDAQLKAIQNEGQIQAMRELLAHAEEATVTKDFLADAGRFIREMVGAVRDALRSMGFKNLSAASTSDIYYLLRKARKSINDHTIGAYQSPNGEIVFRRGTSSIMTAVDKLVRGPTSIANRIQSEVTGIGARTMFIDRLAPMERVAEYLKKSSQAMQMLYYGRLHDQRMSVVGAAVNGGAPTLITDEKGNYVIKSRGGANLMDMAKLFTTVKGHGNAEDVRNLFTAWMATKRAKNPGVGKEKLNFNADVTQADMDEVERAGNAIPEFEKARKMYNEYNGGLVDWLVQSGAVSKDVADALLAVKDYIPYYRAIGDNIVMEIAGVKPVTIGNLQQQPYLKELVGGDQKIQDVFTSSLQNTSMIVDMGLRNLATKEMAFSLQEAGLLATKEDKGGNVRGMFPGTGPAQPNVIRFKRKGKDYYAVVNSEPLGIPSELLVKGLHGTATTIGGLTKLMSIPARFLRAMVTRSPVYAVRQIIRDSTSNFLLAGGDMTPVMSAGKELLKMYAGTSEGEKVLQERGIIGGQILTGTTEDTQKLMLQLSQGGSGWEMALAKLDRAAMKSDAASRVTLYNSFRKQGLSDMEATLATLESMNFSKRGASGSMHALNMMIPFLNSQIQGLDVLSKALRGKMPYNEKVNAQRKLYTRGAMMAASTLAYVAMMQDDEAYKNASMRERLSNWFIRVPGLKEAIRVPIPFEVGLIFKALPEAVLLMNDKDTEVKDVLKGLGGMIAASTPLGLSSLPQGIKPLVEAALNRSFFTGQDIESVKERELLPTERVRDKTSGIAKMLSEGIGAVTSAVGAPTAGVSPIMIDHLINGYTGSVGLAIAQAAGTIMPLKEGPEAPTKRLSDMPVIGSMFQPNDATGQITLFYEKAKEYTQIKETFDKMIAEGRTDEAAKFADKYATQVAMSDVADSFKETMGEFTELERLIKASDLSGEEKRERLDEIRKAKIEFSRSFNAASRQ